MTPNSDLQAQSYSLVTAELSLRGGWQQPGTNCQPGSGLAAVLRVLRKWRLRSGAERDGFSKAAEVRSMLTGGFLRLVRRAWRL